MGAALVCGSSSREPVSASAGLTAAAGRQNISRGRVEAESACVESQPLSVWHVRLQYVQAVLGAFGGCRVGERREGLVKNGISYCLGRG